LLLAEGNEMNQRRREKSSSSPTSPQPPKAKINEIEKDANRKGKLRRRGGGECTYFLVFLFGERTKFNFINKPYERI
jgi:hypothetical protein